MKTAILFILAMALVTSMCNAQTKPVKPQYKKVVVIDIGDYQTLTGALNDSKSSVIYNPGLSADQKVNMQISIDAYLRELPKRVKIDSIKIEK